MTQQIINVGPAPNDGQGDPIRTAYIKCNDNFSQLYSRAQASPPPTLVGSIGDQAGMYASDSSYFYYCFADYDGSSVIWAQVTQVANIAVSAITDGTSNVKLVGLNGDATININGISNIAAFRPSGAYIVGLVSATGNITGSNINGANVIGTRVVGTSISATGNITANNIVVTGYLTTGTGLLSANAYTGPFTDGIVIDYVENNGRISVGTNDNITFYNGGVGNTAIVTFDTNGNIDTGGTFNSTGNIVTQGLVSALGNIETSGYFVGTFIGNVTGNFVVPGSNTQVIFNTSGNADAAGGFTYNKDSNTMTVLGIVSSQGNIIGGNLTTAGRISATSNIAGGNLTTTGSISSTGNISGGNLLTSGFLSTSGNIYGANLVITGGTSDTGNISGGNILTGGIISATGNSYSNTIVLVNDVNAGGNVSASNYNGLTVSVTGNITGGNIKSSGQISSTGNITSAGNISGNYILGNGSQIVGLNTNIIQNGNSNVLIGSSAGNISININGISPVVIFNPLGQFIDGSISASGNIIGGNLVTTGMVTAIGNITTSSSLNTFGTTISSGVSTSGNVTGANLVTIGAIINSEVSTSGNVTAGNIVTSGVLTVNSGNAVTAIVNGGGNATGNIGSSSNYFNTVYATATTALYADLAECYSADTEYEPGTVVCFGGSAEITQCNTDGCPEIAGVISTNPAYKMNSGLDSEYIAIIALTGRVPTKVKGPVKKGAMMVSAGDGYARAEIAPAIGTVIGKAVESFTGDVGTIEIVVGRL